MFTAFEFGGEPRGEKPTNNLEEVMVQVLYFLVMENRVMLHLRTIFVPG
jgi:hypothetical protein